MQLLKELHLGFLVIPVMERCGLPLRVILDVNRGGNSFDHVKMKINSYELW